jgi:hypothetical protein
MRVKIDPVPMARIIHRLQAEPGAPLEHQNDNFSPSSTGTRASHLVLVARKHPDTG